MAKKTIGNILIPAGVVLALIVIGYWILFPADNTKDVFVTYQETELPYQILSPEKIIELPWELTEISGISYYNKNELACIEDENGKIYIVNFKTGEVTRSYTFGKDRDYEDIAVMYDMAQDMVTKIYILRSNGKIYRIKRLGLDNQKVKEYNTFLVNENDAEGLCYHKQINALLITCKNSPRLSQKWNTAGQKKAIYIFDLNKKIMLPDPLFVLDFNAVKSESENLIYANNNFQPSGIAIHPVSGHFYIISSVGNLLVVVNTKGEIVNLTKLSKKLFQQPEGICFLPDGDMFISNEGRYGRGTILRFKYNK